MTFEETLAQISEVLQREQRVSYRALKVRFDLNDDHLEAVKDELIYAKRLAIDEDNRVLVFVGDTDGIPEPTEGAIVVDGENVEISATFEGVTFPLIDPDSVDTEPDQTIVAKVAGVGGGDSEHGDATKKLKANVHCTLN